MLSDHAIVLTLVALMALSVVVSVIYGFVYWDIEI